MSRRKSEPQRRADAENIRMQKRHQRDVNLNTRITALQNCNIPLIPKLPFSRLVREIMHQFKDNFRISAIALTALQEACEFYLTFLFTDAYLLTYHRRRVTLDRSDIRMVLHIRSSSQR